MAKMGRPTKRTPAVEAVILDGLAQGITLVRICKPEGMPSPVTVRQWKRLDEDFATAYARAREDGAEAYADRICEIADEVLLRGDRTFAECARTSIDALKWAAGKHNAQYGDRQKHEHTGEGGKPLTVIIERSADGG
jgi:hypothetical protein